MVFFMRDEMRDSLRRLFSGIVGLSNYSYAGRRHRGRSEERERKGDVRIAGGLNSPFRADVCVGFLAPTEIGVGPNVGH